jgi:hypothetical protein
MSSARLTIPVRWTVEESDTGAHLLHLFVNGAPAGTFVWDGQTLTMQPAEVDKSQDHG